MDVRDNSILVCIISACSDLTEVWLQDGAPKVLKFINWLHEPYITNGDKL